MTTLDDLHLAMGRFLTESSHVENMMLALYSVANQRRSLEQSFNEFMDKTFGGKIKRFKTACGAYPFSEKHRAILNEVYTDLEALLPKRNFIVHGITYQIGTATKPAEAYRIGKRKGDHDFMGEAMANNLLGAHVYTAAGIATVTEEFVTLREKLARVAIDVMRALANKGQAK